MTEQPRSSAQIGLNAVPVETFLLPYLYTMNRPATPAQIAARLKHYLDKSILESGLQHLIAEGLAQDNDGKIALTKAGRARTEQQCGGKIDEKKRTNVIWPALALGLSPGTKSASRLARPENLRAAVLIALYKLPLERDRASLSQAVSALVIRALANVGPPAGAHESIKTLATELGDLSDADKLRAGLIKVALHLQAMPTSEPSRSDLAAFAARVQAITDRLTSPPLTHAVAIAQVYDAYGRQHADAGSLESFKQRLNQAHKDRRLSLVTLDRPEALDASLRDRSAIPLPYGKVHLIARKGET